MAFAVGRPVEISSRDRAVPDLMAAAALPNESAARRAQQLPQLAIKLRRHSGQRLLGFAQRSDLNEYRCRVHAFLLELGKSG